MARKKKLAGVDIGPYGISPPPKFEDAVTELARISGETLEVDSGGKVRVSAESE